LDQSRQQGLTEQAVGRDAASLVGERRHLLKIIQGQFHIGRDMIADQQQPIHLVIRVVTSRLLFAANP
jgi:hypothetical protein